MGKLSDHSNCSHELPLWIIPGWATDATLFQYIFWKGPVHIADVSDPSRTVSDIIDLMDYYKYPQAVVIGFSLGGHLAIDLATQYPTRIKSGALIGVAPEYPHVSLLRQNLVQDREAALTQFCRLGFYQLSDWNRFRKFRLPTLLTGNPESISNGLAYLATRQYPVVPDSITVSIIATYDRIVPVNRVRQWLSAYSIPMISISGRHLDLVESDILKIAVDILAVNL